MAKRRESVRRTPKPLVAVAVFCDRVLEGDDGAMSIINMKDNLTLLILPNALKDPDDRITINTMAFVTLRAGDVVGEHALRLRMRTPTGKRHILLEKTLPFAGGAQNMNIKLNVQLKVSIGST